MSLDTKSIAVKSFTWTIVAITFFVLALGAVLISIVVGDWIFIHTGEAWLGWLVGTFVLFSFLVSLGIVVGTLQWLRTTQNPPDVQTVHTAMDRLVNTASLERED